MARRRWNIETIKQIVAGEQPFIQVGYTGKIKKHKEGDIWEEKRIKWTLRNGVKVRVNEQADSIRELCKRRCSKCGFDIDMLGNKLDEKIFRKTGKCYDCVEADEMILRLNGGYEKYEQEKMLRNKLSLAKEFKRNVLESIDFLKKDDCKIEMVDSSGGITTFLGAQNQKLLTETETDLEKANKLISELEEYIQTHYEQSTR